MALHDICDEWKILFLDDKMNIISKERRFRIKTELEERIKKLQYGDLRYADDFKLSYYDADELLWGEQYSIPEGSPFPKAQKDILELCQNYALENHLNVMVQIFNTATEYGKELIIWMQAAVLFGQTSEADAKVYENIDGEFFTDIDFENETNEEEIQEYLWDTLMDNFDESPWEKDEDNELTEDAEKLYNKCFAYTAKAFFYDLWLDELSASFQQYIPKKYTEEVTEEKTEIIIGNEITGLNPLVGDEPKILILGTMPGNRSLETGEYYASHTNSFWKFMEQIYNKGKKFQNYNEKEECLKANKVAVWDLAHQCEREGSADKNMKNVVYNDLSGFLNEHPTIELLVFNGKKTFKDFEEHFKIEKKCATAPSTSNAYPMSFDKKLEGWKEALGFKK